MMKTRRLLAITLSLILTNLAFGSFVGYWGWEWSNPQHIWRNTSGRSMLTANNGSSSVAWQAYLDEEEHWRLWSTIVAMHESNQQSYSLRARELRDINNPAGVFQITDDGLDADAGDVCVTISPAGVKHAVWRGMDQQNVVGVWTARQALATPENDWEDVSNLSPGLTIPSEGGLMAVAALDVGGSDFVFVAFDAVDEEGVAGLYLARSTGRSQLASLRPNRHVWVRGRAMGIGPLACRPRKPVLRLLVLGRRSRGQL